MSIENLASKQHFYKSLNERQKRHFAALEAQSLGYGGIQSVSDAFSISVVTIREGIRELKEKDEISSGRVRKEGGGRKKNFRRHLN